MDAITDLLVQDMRAVFGSDQKRIDHALLVLGGAMHVWSKEGGDLLVIQAAAILHDIGIQEAERKYKSSAGRYQEREGPAIAERILRNRGVAEDRITHVCRIIANHHSARNIDTLEFRVLWDADGLVNLPEMCQDAFDVDWKARIHRIFKTNTGRETALRLFTGS
jgi:hypothetical protein